MQKKVIFIFILFASAVGAKAQTNPPPEIPHDTIFRLNGSLIPVDVTTVTPTYISFVFPGKAEEFTIERKEVHKIIYKTGKVDILNDQSLQLVTRHLAVLAEVRW